MVVSNAASKPRKVIKSISKIDLGIYKFSPRNSICIIKCDLFYKDTTNEFGMRCAIIGPVCKDINMIGEKRIEQTGGVTYYTGQALSSMKVETIVFGYYNKKDSPIADGFKFNLFPIETQGTITFRNIYPDPQNLDIRIQKAETPNNRITVDDIPPGRLSGLDYLIFGPLYHDNISASTIEEFTGNVDNDTKLVLSPQGLIRYLEGDKIVWRNPENVRDALPHVDYVFFDDKELEFVSGRSKIVDGVRCLQDEYGAKNVTVTQGSKGSYLFFWDEICTIRAFPPRELVDTTGAGDSYMAGFIRAQGLFKDPLEQGEFAAMTATMAIEMKGPFSGTVEEVRERLCLAKQF